MSVQFWLNFYHNVQECEQNYIDGADDIFQLFWSEKKTDDCQVLQECEKSEEFFSRLEQNSDFNYENSNG